MNADPRRYPLDRARALAHALVEALRPGCHRIEIAGSVRRGVPRVKDVELVAIPRFRHDLFGGKSESELGPVLDQLGREGKLAARTVSIHRKSGAVEHGHRMGERYKALVAVRSGIPVDLFLPQDPQEWGAALAIRTGPADFSKMLVTNALAVGLRCAGNVLRREDGTVVPTPEERDFFEAVGVRWCAPEERR